MHTPAFRFSALCFAASAAVLSASPIHAQNGAMAPEECGGFDSGPIGAPANAPPEGDVAFFGSVFVAVPAHAQTFVPRNVVVRLSGAVSGLRSDPPMFELRVVRDDGLEIPYLLDGDDVRPTVLLDANRDFSVVVSPTDAHECPECAPVQTTTFTTSSIVDVVAPVITDDARAHVILNAEDPCFDFGPNHFLVARLERGDIDVAMVQVTAVREFTGTTLSLGLFSTFNRADVVVSGTFGQDDVSLYENFSVAFTPVDLAGNVGPATTFRIKSEDGRDLQSIEELAFSSCDMPARPAVSSGGVLPANGLIRVEFPVEISPLALRLDDGTMVPLVAVDDKSRRVQLLSPVSPLPSSGNAALVALPCADCTCLGCALGIDDVFELGPVDEIAPDEPRVLFIREDVDPPTVNGGACLPDETALVVVISPGKDDRAEPLRVRYRAAIRVNGGPPLVVGRALEPALLKDGTHAIRLDTGRFGRLLSEDLELTLTALDEAGNESSTVFERPTTDSAAGCASVTSSDRAVFASFGILILLSSRRRRAILRA